MHRDLEEEDSSTHQETITSLYTLPDRTMIPTIRIDAAHASDKGQHPDCAKTNADEGRLSFHDDVFLDSQRLLKAPKAKGIPKPKTHGQPTGKGAAAVAKSTRRKATATQEVSEQAKRDADTFLLNLEAEILTGRAPPCNAAGNNAADDKMSNDGAGSQGSRGDARIAKEDPTLYKAEDGSQYRLVREPQFSPGVISLFQGRANPIIHAKRPRKTANQMWDETKLSNAK